MLIANAERNTSYPSFPPRNRAHFKQGLLINYYLLAQRKGTPAGKLPGKQETKGHLWRGRAVTTAVITPESFLLGLGS